MKKILFIMAALVLSAATVSAQDLITKKTGEDIKAKVLEIDNNNVKYKLFEEPNGVTYTMPKSQILMIRYESGRNEVFNTAPSVPSAYNGYAVSTREPIEGIVPGMKYNQLKSIYDYRNWLPEMGDKHNPAVMGVCSWIVPGLGQMISGEIGRGFGWFGGAVGSAVLMSVGSGLTAGAAAMAYDSSLAGEMEGQIIAGTILTIVGSVALLTVDICAIVDACRVAKVRNMYEQDLRKASYSLEIHPSVDYIRMADKVHPTTGLTLTMNF